LPWDLGTTLGRYGASRAALYCPANPGQNIDNLWNYVPNYYRIIGYSMTLSGGPSISGTNWNATLTPQPILYGPIIGPPALASQRVLVADATLSQSGQDNEASRSSYNYSSIQGSYAAPMRTSHLDRSLPAGGNLGMLDGHVEWRSFQAMHVRTPQGSGTPVFWW
jgi:prepilin-type processing-associated H-X9-DG protein